MANAKFAARLIAPIGATALILGAVSPVPPASVPTTSPVVMLLADATALVLCGTTCPTPDATYIDIVRNQYVAPTHPGESIDYVPVTIPNEMWPVTGVLRVLGLALGDQRIFGPGGPAWPDEPWLKLTGLFDMTANQSLRAGADDLTAAIDAHGNDNLVIYGLSQGAGVANVVKKQLALQYPAGTTAPHIDFVLSGDPNLPNGGLMSRFPGVYIPVLDFAFNGPAATDTPFTTVEIARQYDGFTDFPLYPANLLADLNAVLGVVYEHMFSFDVSLPPQPTTSPAFQGTHGDTSYYFFTTADLPLFGPLRALGVPEPMIDVVEPVFRVLVELGYDRSIPLWEPTQARPAPRPNLPKLTADLTAAVHEGLDNARSLIGLPPAAQTIPSTNAQRQPADALPAAPASPEQGAAAREGKLPGEPGHARKPAASVPSSPRAIQDERAHTAGPRGVSGNRHARSR